MQNKLGIRTCFWFERDGLAAAKAYVDLFPNSALECEAEGPEPLVVPFRLGGVPYQILNGGPRFQLNEAASILVMTPDQAETDRLWSALSADGGQESQCGWLIDRWGLSWQIVPRLLPELLGAADRQAADRAAQAMFGMKKLIIAELQCAFDGA